MSDPLESILTYHFEHEGIKAIKDGDEGNQGKGLDFYLPDHDIYVEVTAYHTPRKIEQMSRADNIILIQGKRACEAFIRNFRLNDEGKKL